MTDETLNPSQTDADAQAKRTALETEAAELGLKVDKRFSDKRIADMIAEKRGETPAVTPPTPPYTGHLDVAREQDGMVPLSELEALQAKLAEANAALAAKDKAPEEPPPQPYNAPRGMTTSMNMPSSGVLGREEDERRLLMERAVSLGIGNEIRPGANADGIREAIMRHVATKADEMNQRAEADRIKALGPQAQLVTIRVLKSGDGKISKGIHIPGVGDACYVKGDLIESVLKKYADHYEDIGYAEIV
jgi:hypothetical protein